jgi:flagellar M-ring protein FliF
VLGEDRFDLTIKYELDFDQTVVKKSEIIPIIMQEDDPEVPYSTLVTVLDATVSKKVTKEEFKGPTYIPEGPAGTENNIPPGLKEKINRFSHYTKDENIENVTHSTKEEETKKAPYTIKRIAVAAWIDGEWKKVYKDGELVMTEENSIKRDYIPVDSAKLRDVSDILQRAIAFNAGRGDQVVVRHLQFDRRKEHDAEDEEIRRKERIRKILIASLLGVFVLFLGTLAYRVISKEIARRRRIREEELALQQQRMREQALRPAEAEGVEVELSLEEKARLEMQENAINMARERPEDVAALLRTWLMEE